MGLIVEIYRNGYGNCSNGGVSARFKHLTITNIEGPFEPSPDAPAATLKPGAFPDYPVIVPDEVGTRWSMFGGCFAYSSDGRFVAAVDAITGGRHGRPVSIHDRVE